jgi:hypothetical protein
MFSPDLLARPIQRGVEVEGRQQPMRSLASSQRLVAYPDRTAFFGDYFRVAGHSGPKPGRATLLSNAR